MEEQITISYQTYTLDIDELKKQEKELRDEAAKIPRDVFEGDTITTLNRIALSYTQCKDPQPELEKIPPLERRLIELDALQIDADLHDGYWEKYRNTGSADRRGVTNKSPWFYARNESKMNVTTVTNRELQSYTGDDYIMIGELRAEDRPSRLTTCVDGEILTGFQVFYGEYDEIAGAAHGDLSTECTNTLINQEIHMVNFYGSEDGKTYIVGMEVVLQPFRDEAYPGTTVTAGTVNVEGQEKRSVTMPNKRESGNDFPMFFFGF